MNAIATGGNGYMTEERQRLQETAREFTMKEVLPVANKLDPVKGEIPIKLREKMAEMGYFGILTEKKYGGMGLGVFEYCLITEELARGWLSVASILARGNKIFGTQHLSEEQRQKYLHRSAKGEFLEALALSEPDTGSDLSTIACRAFRDQNEWVISGKKYWCTFADEADCILLVARTSEPSDPKHRHLGISAFIVEKERGKLPKGCSGVPIPTIGYFGWKTYELTFDGCRIPLDALIGEEGKAFYIMAEVLETERAYTAARSIGLARGGLEDAIAYSQGRIQFKRPIAYFQATRFKIADMATEVEAARHLLYYVCNQIDQKQPCSKEASMVKLFASEMAERVTSEALQIHGGVGYTTNHAVERYWREARLTKIFEGSSEIQKRVISDSILGRAGRT